ncbi:hypothetical protein CDL15_Pgr004583 [Punica granatum]|uniref:Uncharacterized protein n=1 Tax=Punica granatum TaxID=22663 RepID=A0A218WQA4_PUNGR|nr:hypothetical protein CDL15_Pgr004583 [Punica granatum]
MPLPTRHPPRPPRYVMAKSSLHKPFIFSGDQSSMVEIKAAWWNQQHRLPPFV